MHFDDFASGTTILPVQSLNLDVSCNEWAMDSNHDPIKINVLKIVYTAAMLLVFPWPLNNEYLYNALIVLLGKGCEIK